MKRQARRIQFMECASFSRIDDVLSLAESTARCNRDSSPVRVRLTTLLSLRRREAG